MLKVILAVIALLGAAILVVIVLPALMPADGLAGPIGLPGGLPPGPAGTGGAAVPSGLQPLFADVPPGGFPHDTYAPGNCTWWAAYNRPLPPDLGDAWQWMGNAAAHGLPTSSQPSVGAVAVYGRSPAYDPVHGHVAVVTGTGQGSFTVSEMNFRGLGLVDQRTSPWPDPHLEGFVLP